MAIGYDTKSSTSGIGVASLNIPPFAPSGSAGYLFCGAGGSTGVAVSVSSVTRNAGAESFTELWDLAHASTGAGSSGHRLINPAVGSYTVVVTFSTTCDDCVAGVVSLTGVHQTTPEGTPVTAQGTSTAPSVTVTAADDEWLEDFCYCGNAGGPTFVADANQIERFKHLGAGYGWGNGGSSTQLGSVAGDVMSWTIGASSVWTIGAVAIKPAAAESPPPPPVMAAQQRMG